MPVFGLWNNPVTLNGVSMEIYFVDYIILLIFIRMTDIIQLMVITYIL